MLGLLTSMGNRGGKAGREGGSQQRPMLVKRGPKFMREKLRGKSVFIPSVITVVGIFCGFLGLISALQGKYEYATKCIFLAIVLDGLDGRVARRLNATSPFGREFDSLSDLVAFGVAPAVLVYVWAFGHTADEFGLIASFLFVVCGALRLARFNVAIVEPGEMKSSFVGLPIPAAAAAVASIVYCFPERIYNIFAVTFLLVYMIFIAVLMVSRLPFLSIKHLKLTTGKLWLNVLMLAFLVALTWKFSQVVLLTGSTGYALSGMAIYLWRKMYRRSVIDEPRAFHTSA